MDPIFAALMAHINQGAVLREDGSRVDSAQTAFLERQLVQVRSKIFDVKKVTLKARQFLPKATDIPSGTQVFVQAIYDFVGMAKIISAGGAKDLPRADVVVQEVVGKVYTLGVSFGWNLQDIRSALLARLPLTTKKNQAAQKVMEMTIDYMLAYGAPLVVTGQVQSQLHTYGMLNMPNVPDISADLTGDWDGAATSAQILADLNRVASAPSLATKQIYPANAMLIAPTWFEFLNTTPYSSTIPDSILSVFLRNSTYIKKVDQWDRLETAGTGGIPRIMAYHLSPEVLEAVIPSEFEMMPVQIHGLEYEVPCVQECGGVIVHHPLAIVYADVDHA